MPRIRPVARRALAAQSDERLVKLLREGHDPAFNEIVGRYQGPLTAFAAAFIPYHRAEDVVQASLLKAHKALLTDDREIALRAWLFTIVRNGALNAIRDEPDWQELDPAYDGVPQPPAIAEQNEELQRLVVAICALPEAQRRALVGRELEGEGHAELATELGTTTTAVRGLIFRARTALRDSLGALIPLPVLRMLLSQGSAAGAGAGAGAGLGLGAAGLGGGAKVAATITAAALVVGGGIALEKKNGNRESGGTEVAKAAVQDSEGGSGGATGSAALSGTSPDTTSTGGDSGSGGNTRAGDSNESGDGSGSGNSGSGSSGSGDSGSGDDSGPGGHQSGHEPGDDDSSGPGPGPAPEPGDDDGGHSGPGGGGDDDGGTDDGGDSSGPGSGELPEPDDGIDDGSHSGPGGGEDLPEPDESLDDGGDDHSGTSGGDEPDDD